jgi:hypothetical protein
MVHAVTKVPGLSAARPTVIRSGPPRRPARPLQLGQEELLVILIDRGHRGLQGVDVRQEGLDGGGAVQFREPSLEVRQPLLVARSRTRTGFSYLPRSGLA